ERARRSTPLRSVSRPAPAARPRARLARPDYAAAAEALAALGRALDLAEGPVATPLQDTSVLYEAWAALETVHAFACALGDNVSLRPFRSEPLGSGPAVRLVGERAEVDVVRTPRFAGPPALLVQIPDLLVTVRRPCQPTHTVVLDAKYRLDASGAAPPGDALGSLHRYRDAIVGPDGRALVQTAAVLFPARPGAGFEGARVWTSLATLGIGAVPLLPGATEWLDRLATRLVSDGPS
ncbi:MAG TPA: nuclease domain-containing protein, partial [Rubricoccaceae bacterium]